MATLAMRCMARLRAALALRTDSAAASASTARRLAFTREHYLTPLLSRENNFSAAASAVVASVPPPEEGGGDTGLFRNPRRIPPAVRLYDDGDPLIGISSLLDVQDIAQVDLLTDYVRTHHPGQFERARSFDASPVEYLAGEAVYVDDVADGGGDGGGGGSNGGGNDVVFLEGILQSTMPNLVRHVLRSVALATDAAGWSPHPRQLGVRCVESLLYHPDGELRLHTDSESIYTVVVMLSDPTTSGGGGESSAGASVEGGGGGGDRFTGGDFVIEQHHRADDAGGGCADDNPAAAPRQGLLRASPRRGDAIVFDSNASHGVDSVLSGRRRVLVFELWPFDDAAEGDRRPSRDSFLHRQKLPEIHIPERRAA